MADEAGQSIGNITVGVDLDLTVAKEQLGAFAQEATATAQKAARDATPKGQGSGTGTPQKTSVDADVKIKSADVVKAVQTALDGHEFKLLIDQGFLRSQVENALKGLQIPIGAAAGQPHQVVAAAQQAAVARTIPPEVAKAFNQVHAFPGAVNELYDEMRSSLRGIGKSFGTIKTGDAGRGIDKAVEIINELGGSLEDIYGAFGKNPGALASLKKAASVVESNLGVSGDSAKNIATLVYQFKREGSAALPTIRPFAAQAMQPTTPTPVSIVHEDRNTAKARAAAESEATKVDRLEAQARSNLAPIRVGRSVDIGTLSRDARAFAAATAPSVAAIVKTGLAGEVGLGDKLSARRPFEGVGQANIFGRNAGSARPFSEGPGLPRLVPGEDPEADIRSVEQLGRRSDRSQINWNALRSGGGPADIDLRPIMALAAQGKINNFVRDPKTGNFTPLEPTGVEGTQERFDSEARIRGFMRSKRRTSIPGFDNQVVPQSPRQIVSAMAGELFGKPGTAFLKTPRVQAEVGKALRQGGGGAPPGGIQTGGFAHIGAAGPSSILGGAQDEVALQERLRLEIYKSLPSWMGRGARQQITKEILPQRMAEIMRVAAESSRESGLESRGRIDEGFGLTSQEAFKKELKAALPGLTRSHIESGQLPDFTKIPEALLAEVQAGEFAGGRRSFASRRKREITNLLLKGGGADATQESVSKTLGIPVTEEQAEAFQGPIPNAQRIKGLINDVFGSFVGGLEPGRGRALLTSHGRSITGRELEDRGAFGGLPKSFADQDARQGGGGSRIAVRAPTTLATKIAGLELEIKNERVLEEQRKKLEDASQEPGLSPVRSSRQRAGLDPTPSVPRGAVRADVSKLRAQVNELGLVREAAESALAGSTLNFVGKGAGEPVPSNLKSGESVPGARAAAISGLFKLAPDASTEVEETLRNRAMAIAASRPGKVPTGDDARRAAAKTATVSGEVTPKDVVPSFTEFNASAGRVGRGAVPPGTPPPAGRGAFDSFDGGVIHVIVDNTPLPVTIEGVGTSQGTGSGLSQGQAGLLATSKFRANRADLGKQTSPSAQAAFGRDVERLRTQLGLSDAQIKKLAKGSGLGVAADAFFPEDETAGGGFGPGGRGNLNARRRRLGLEPIQFRTQETLNALDTADETRAGITAEVRKAQRFEPRRGFTASATDIFTNLFPFIEGQSKSIARFAREGTQQAGLEAKTPTLVEDREAARKHLEDVTRLREEAVAQRDAAKASGSASGSVSKLNGQIKLFDKELATSQGALDKATDNLDQHNLALDDQAKRTQAARAALPGAGGKVAAFGAGFVAAAGAVAVGQLVANLAITVMQDIATAIGPAIDRAAGSPSVTSALAHGIATAGASGNFAAATAQLTAQAGIAPGGFEGLTTRGRGLAGNAALISQFDLIRGEQNIERGNKGLPPGFDRSLVQSTGGIFGSGIGITGIGDFQLSTQAILAEGLKNLPALSERNTTRQDVFGGRETEGFFQAFPDAAPENYIPPSLFNEGASALKQFNKDVKDGGSNLQLVFAESLGKGSKEVEAFAKSLEAVGAKELAGVVREKGLLFTGGASTGASGLQALQAAQQSAAGFNVESLLAANAPARRAQEFLRQRRIEQAQQTSIPGQFGIQNALTPLPSISQLQGLAPGADISSASAVFDEISGATSEAVKNAKAFVAEQLPNYGDAFASSLDRAAGFAARINDIQIGVQIEAASLNADKYAHSIDIANRSLQDAKGLTGEIKDVGEDNLGVLERQSFLLQRQAQSLSIELSQLQINFQRAVAGFVAPGATPEERAARIKEAEKEAAIAQEQLDIQKEQFKLGGITFKIQGERQVKDLIAQIAFLQRDYQLQLHSTAAQEEVKGLSKLLDVEAQRANELFNEAIAKQGDVFTVQAELIATTGEALAKIEKLTLQSFASTYTGMIEYIRDHPVGGLTDLAGGKGQTKLAGGALFNTGSGSVGSAIIGEAGNETVAVLSNPRSFIMGGGGGGDVFNIYVTGNRFSTEEDERRLVTSLTSEIERRMGRNFALYGGRRPS